MLTTAAEAGRSLAGLVDPGLVLDREARRFSVSEVPSSGSPVLDRAILVTRLMEW
jgi:hypothetical protein